MRITDALLGLFMVICGVTPTSATMLEATPANITAQLAVARPGDTVRLVGNFGMVTLPRKTWSPTLTIDASAATMTGMNLSQVHGVEVLGGRVNAAERDWKAINIMDSSHVRIAGTAIDGAIVAVSTYRVSDIELAELDITGVGADGIDLAGAQRVSVHNVTCHDFSLLDDYHPDCIQSWPLAGYPARDIVLRDNVAIGEMQGFWFGDNGDGTGFDRIIIENNFFRIGYWHAVAINNVRDSVVRYNHAESSGVLKNGRPIQPWVKIFSGERNIACSNETPDLPVSMRDGPC